jgi:RimJ/RimL family protein N-acetyltransferase
MNEALEARNSFSTLRLRFRSFEPEDLDPLFTIHSDPETSRYVGDGTTLSRELTRTWIENSRRNVAEYGYGTGAVVLTKTGELIGWAGMARPGDGTEEIIYGLAREHWGQGLGTELLAGLIQWSGQALNAERLRATVHRDNSASIAMLLRQGFDLKDAAHDGDPRTHLYELEFSKLKQVTT